MASNIKLNVEFWKNFDFRKIEIIFSCKIIDNLCFIHNFENICFCRKESEYSGWISWTAHNFTILKTKNLPKVST